MTMQEKQQDDMGHLGEQKHVQNSSATFTCEPCGYLIGACGMARLHSLHLLITPCQGTRCPLEISEVASSIFDPKKPKSCPKVLCWR